MAKRENQKVKLIKLLGLLMARTDMDEGLTLSEIIDGLAEEGISAERKSIYDDMQALSDLGFTVEKLPTRPTTYTLSERVFELAELKLLVDAVQSCKFITPERSRNIIDKLRLFAGKKGAGELSRQVYVEGRAKTMNKATLYSIDSIHTAINSAKQLSFRYFGFNSEKQKVYHRSGESYSVSPLHLCWDDENYYLVGIDESEGVRKNFRVDKMDSVRVIDLPRSEDALNVGGNSADYSRKIFGMYGGEEVLVTLECHESIANSIIDRFGTEPVFIKLPGGVFRVSVRVIVSPNFFAWVLRFGSRLKIISPDKVTEQFVSELRSTLAVYEDRS